MTAFDKLRQVLECYRENNRHYADDPNGFFAGVVEGCDDVFEFMDDIEAGKL